MPAAIAVPAIIGAASAGASIYGAHKSSKATTQAARLQTEQNNYAADLEAKAAAEALAFAKEQEATRRKEFEGTQARNYEIYNREDARKQPYRNFSLGAIAGLSKPIYAPGTYPPGSLGARLKG